MLAKLRYGFWAAALVLALFAVPVMAQNTGGGGNGGGGGGGGNGGGGRGGFNPGQMRQRMMDQLKEKMGASDDEFKALQPKIEKVQQLQRDLTGGGMRAFFRGFRGGRGGDAAGAAGGGAAAPEQPQSTVEQKSQDLQTALDNKDAKPEDIKAKLDALRDAKGKVKEELTAAQADLKGLLTQRQEAVLVEFGILD